MLLGESDKFFLQQAFLAQIHLQIHHGGLHILMAQPVFNGRYGFSLRKHSNSAGVPEAVSRIYEIQPFSTERPVEILFAQAIDAVASKVSATLVDKQVCFTKRIGSAAILCNILINKSGGFRQKLDLAISISFSEDRQCSV